jgi:O-antigen/teichoic acid export membrane protein
MAFSGLWTLRQVQVTDFDHALVISLLPNALVFAVALWKAGGFRRIAVNRTHALEIFQNARGFLLFSVLSAGTLAVDYLVMSQMLPAEDIATYNLMSKVFGVILSIHAVLLANAWSQMGDHLHAGSFIEARQRMRWLITLGLAGGVVAGVVTISSMNWIMPLLAGDKIIEVSTSLMIIWAIYILIRIWSDSYAMGLMSFNKMSVMNKYIPFQALTNVMAQCALGYWLGLPGILLGLITSYLATAAWVLPKYFYKESAVSN